MKTLARDRDKAEILSRLRRVRPDSARQWGRMSAHEMVCHLTDACRMAFGEMPVSDASSFGQRTLVKWIALYSPRPWPRGVLATRPEIEQGLGGTRPGEFTADVAALEAYVEMVAQRQPGAPWPVHPIFGRMSHGAWLRWAYLHADHHLRQFGV